VRWLLALLLPATIARAAIITAANPGPAALSNAMVAVTAAGAGNTLVIPAGISNYTYPLTWSAPANTTILGAGSLTTSGGGDATVIVDNYNGSGGLLNITAHASGTLRIAGITFRGHATFSPLKQNGLIGFAGGKVRIDHCHWDANQGNIRLVYLGVYGVMHNCILDHGGGTLFFGDGSGTGDAGDYVWSLPTDFGTDRFFYLEDNLFRGVVSGPTAIADGNTAARVVVRFNTIQGLAGMEIHATGHSSDDRGARAVELYRNLFTVLPGQLNAPYSAAAPGSGTWLLWGNTSEENNLKSGFFFNVTRKNSVTYPEVPTPDAWGYAGPAPIATGTVNVVNGTNVVYVSGNNFSTSWPNGSMIWIEGSSCQAFTGQAPGVIASGAIGIVNSTTSLTLTNGGHSGANLTGVRYAVGSAWDGNTDVYGYPNLDQPGRGQGDLLMGVFPNKTNAALGGIAWPRQALEPIYGWDNNIVPHPGYGGGTEFYNLDAAAGRVVLDRDVYHEATGIQTSPTSPFNGTSGTGWGTLANRPTTCVPGVAYWATDQGSWNTSTTNTYGVQMNGADGVLYKATATNVWTLYYVPFTYPHPLRGESQAKTQRISAEKTRTGVLIVR
jgi:hypothetical protein